MKNVEECKSVTFYTFVREITKKKCSELRKILQIYRTAKAAC